MINKILNDPKLMSKLDNEFFSLFTGFTKEEILEVVNQLDNNKKLIIELYFGLNGKEKQVLEELVE